MRQADEGTASFDAADRLAIINLLGMYAYTYDEILLDEHFALFTEHAEIRFVHADTTFVDGMEGFRRGLGARREAFRAAKNQRRHAMNSVSFTSQTATEASGRCYFQVFGSRDAGPPDVEFTGVYEFTATKVGDSWIFSRWIARLDQAPV